MSARAILLDAPRRSLPASAEDLREYVRRHEHYQRVDRYLRNARRRPDLRASVPGNAYLLHSGASAVALAAATAKTLWYLNVGAANQPSLVELCVGFDGVTASAVPALVELTYGTAATNSTPGTGSTSFTPLQLRGWPAQPSQATAANTITSEPTVQTMTRHWLLSPNGGLLVLQFPMGREPTGIVTAAASGKQLACRVTAPAVVNARSYCEYEE